MAASSSSEYANHPTVIIGGVFDPNSNAHLYQQHAQQLLIGLAPSPAPSSNVFTPLQQQQHQYEMDYHMQRYYQQEQGVFDGVQEATAYRAGKKADSFFCCFFAKFVLVSGVQHSFIVLQPESSRSFLVLMDVFGS